MGKKTVIIIGVVCAIAAVIAFLGSRVKPGARVSGGPAVATLLSQAKGLEASGNLPASREAYLKLVSEFSNQKEVIEWQRKAEQLNIRLLFSPVITAKSLQYEIKDGDSLEKIAREHKTTVEMIKKANAIFEDRIYPGIKIKVWNRPFSIFVDKSENQLLLKCDEELVKTYTVATGRNNSTPVGTFKIIEKIMNPTWYKDNKAIPASSPENILGTRWMGWDKDGYGIHGTTEPQSLGKQATAGCVRMANREVEELYAIVPRGTEVVVVD